MFQRFALPLALTVGVLVPSAVGAADGSPAPSADQGTVPMVLERTASVEADGVMLKITVDRSPLTTDGPVRVTTLVRNVGDDDLIWYHDRCAISVGIKGMMLGDGWRSSEPPKEQDPRSFLWRAHEFWIGALDEIYLDFIPPRYLDESKVLCADIGIRDRIKPGGVLRGQQVWDGGAEGDLGPPPDGPVRLTGTFGLYTRPSLEGGPNRELEVTLDTWLAGGRDASLLHPMEILDSALSDDGFRNWLESSEPATGARDIVRYDPSLNLWEVGYFDYDTDRFHLGLVDPRTGEVLTIIERPWNEEREPYP